MLSPLAILWYQILLSPICSCNHFQVWFYFTWPHLYIKHGHWNWYSRYSTCCTSILASSIKNFSPSFCTHDNMIIFSILWSQWSEEWNYQWWLALVLLMLLLWSSQMNVTPPKMSLLPKHSFGSKNENVVWPDHKFLQGIIAHIICTCTYARLQEHPFRPEWHKKYGWL